MLLSSRKAPELEAAVAQLKSEGIKAEWIAADAGKDADVARLADDAIARLGHVDILVNNAGASWGAPAEEHPIEAWDKVMNLNIRGIFLLTQLIGRKSMLPRKSGRIVNVASIAGLGGNPAFMKTIAYNTSKGVVGGDAHQRIVGEGREGVVGLVGQDVAVGQEQEARPPGSEFTGPGAARPVRQVPAALKQLPCERSNRPAAANRPKVALKISLQINHLERAT